MDTERIIKITNDICEIKEVIDVMREDREFISRKWTIYYKRISDLEKIPTISNETINVISNALIAEYEEQIERLEKELKKIVNE